MLQTKFFGFYFCSSINLGWLFRAESHQKTPTRGLKSYEILGKKSGIPTRKNVNYSKNKPKVKHQHSPTFRFIPLRTFIYHFVHQGLWVHLPQEARLSHPGWPCSRTAVFPWILRRPWVQQNGWRHPCPGRKRNLNLPRSSQNPERTIIAWRGPLRQSATLSAGRAAERRGHLAGLERFILKVKFNFYYLKKNPSIWNYIYTKIKPKNSSKFWTASLTREFL